ncbi:MAG: hypothetical protein IBJ03_16230 [Gemmatimonadaceae bacterium]|nr:hypothetical protein [Gemmatimonadaceae bacterium]
MRTRLLVPAILSAVLATGAINAQSPAKPAQTVPAKHDSTKAGTHAKTAAAATKGAPATTHQAPKSKTDSAKPTASHMPANKKPPM